jgi:hypothetical protein
MKIETQSLPARVWEAVVMAIFARPSSHKNDILKKKGIAGISRLGRNLKYTSGKNVSKISSKKL